MKRFLGGAGLVIAVLLGLNIVMLLLFRTGSDRVTDHVRSFNKRFLNPVMSRFAGKRGFYAAAIHHTGRTSGRPYATPVLAEPTPGGFVIPLPYGTRVDWLKNVRAAGSAGLHIDGAAFDLERPEIISSADAAPYLAVRLRRRLDRYGVSEYLQVRVAERETAALGGG